MLDCVERSRFDELQTPGFVWVAAAKLFGPPQVYDGAGLVSMITLRNGVKDWQIGRAKIGVLGSNGV
jgi:hypothetical protein